MKCYICAQTDKDADAVAICIVCGMGVCMEHAVKDQLSFWEAQFISSDMFPDNVRFSLPKLLPRILCVECYEIMRVEKLPLEFKES